MPRASRGFPSLGHCNRYGRKAHAVAAGLDGALLASRSPFPYFMLLAVEAGSFLRGLALLLASPLALLLYNLVSEDAGIRLFIFVSLAGLPMSSIERVSATVLPRFYGADVREDSWLAFRACGRRRVVVTANPSVLVRPFVREWLGGDAVLGTELGVWRGGATGLVRSPGVLVGERKAETLQREFAGDVLPELGLGDRDSDHHFMALCKEAFVVPRDPSAAKLLPEELAPTTTFHDGRLAFRPDPLPCLLMFLWIPCNAFLSALCLSFSLLLPSCLLRPFYALTHVKLRVRGSPPRRHSLRVSNRRGPLDILMLSATLGRPVRRVDSTSDAAAVARLLESGDVVVYPEGAACREPFLLRFDAGFAGLGGCVVPVAVRTEEGVFHGATAGGRWWADVWFWFANPRPVYEVTFLGRVKKGEGMEAEEELAREVERRLGVTLGIRPTLLTKRDKYMKLGVVSGHEDDLCRQQYTRRSFSIIITVEDLFIFKDNRISAS